MFRPTRLSVILALALAACGGVPVVSLEESRATATSTTDSAAVVEQGTGEAAETSAVEPESGGGQVASGEEAAEYVEAYSNAVFEVYGDAVSEGLRVAGSERILEFFAPGMGYELEPFHSCLSEQFLELRLFVGEDAEFEASLSVEQVIEIQPGMWVVETADTVFVTGVGEQIGDSSFYVTPNGLLVSAIRDEGENECFEEYFPNDETAALIGAFDSAYKG